MKNSTVSILICIALYAFCASAGSSSAGYPQESPPAGVTAASGAQPTAIEVIQNSIEAYRGFATYQDNFDVDVRITYHDPERESPIPETHYAGSTAFRSPFHVSLDRENISLFSDGLVLRIVNRNEQTYIERPVGVGMIRPEYTAPIYFDPCASHPGLAMLTSDADNFTAVFPQVARLSSCAEDILDGNACYRISGLLEQLRSYGPRQFSSGPRLPFTWWIDKSTGFILEVEIDRTPILKAWADEARMNSADSEYVLAIDNVESFIYSVSFRDIMTDQPIPDDRFLFTQVGLERVISFRNPVYLPDAAKPLLLVGGTAPHFVGEDLEGVRVELSAFQGRAVLLVFWAAWNDKSVAFLPEVEKLLAENPPGSLSIIGINEDGIEQSEAVRDVVGSNALSFSQVIDGEGEIGDSYHLETLPTVVLVDASGVVQDVVQGYRENTTDSIRDRLEGLLDGRRLYTPQSLSVALDRIDSQRFSNSVTADECTVSIEGTVVVQDSDGARHSGASGSFVLEFWMPTDPDDPDNTSFSMNGSQPVRITKGRWKAMAPPGRKLEIAELELEGRSAVLVSDTDESEQPSPFDQFKLSVPTNGKIDIICRWLADVSIDAVDAETNRRLDGITVVHSDGWASSGDHPGDYETEDVLVWEAASPVLIKAPQGFSGPVLDTDVWITAKGYAWENVHIDFMRPGTRVIALHPGAALKVSLDNYHPDPRGHSGDSGWTRGGRGSGAASRPEAPSMQPVIRINKAPDQDPDELLTQLLEKAESLPDDAFPEGQRMTTEELRSAIEKAFSSGMARGDLCAEVLPNRSGTTRIDGLRPGSYRLYVEIGESYESPVTLAEADVELTAGSETAINLVLADPPELPDPVPLSGILYLPESWNCDSLTLYFEPLDLPNAEYEDQVRLELESMTRVEDRPGVFEWDAGLVYPGRYDVKFFELSFGTRIEVPDTGLADCELRINEPADVLVRVVDSATGKEVRLDHITWHYGEVYSRLPPAGFNPKSGRYTFRCPAGRVEIQIHESGWAWTRKVVEAAPGRNEVTLEATRACGVKFVFHDDDMPVSVSHDIIFEIESERLDGPGRQTGSSSDGQIKVSNPGLYRFSIPPINGYEPVEPVEVEIRASEFTEVKVPLVRVK